jgi:hypothetical protein
MSNDGDYVERVVETPTTVRTKEVRVVRERSSAGWWIAALVAIVAIVGVIFLLNGGMNSQTDLQAARDQGAAQAQAENAVAGAQTAASQAAQSAQVAVENSARASETAARAAADRTSAAVNDATSATRDAVAREPDAPPPQQP